MTKRKSTILRYYCQWTTIHGIRNDFDWEGWVVFDRLTPDIEMGETSIWVCLCRNQRQAKRIVSALNDLDNKNAVLAANNRQNLRRGLAPQSEPLIKEDNNVNV